MNIWDLLNRSDNIISLAIVVCGLYKFSRRAYDKNRESLSNLLKSIRWKRKSKDIAAAERILEAVKGAERYSKYLFKLQRYKKDKQAFYDDVIGDGIKAASHLAVAFLSLFFGVFLGFGAVTDYRLFQDHRLIQISTEITITISKIFISPAAYYFLPFASFLIETRRTMHDLDNYEEIEKWIPKFMESLSSLDETLQDVLNKRQSQRDQAAIAEGVKTE